MDIDSPPSDLERQNGRHSILRCNTRTPVLHRAVPLRTLIGCQKKDSPPGEHRHTDEVRDVLLENTRAHVDGTHRTHSLLRSGSGISECVLRVPSACVFVSSMITPSAPSRSKCVLRVPYTCALVFSNKTSRTSSACRCSPGGLSISIYVNSLRRSRRYQL